MLKGRHFLYEYVVRYGVLVYWYVLLCLLTTGIWNITAQQVASGHEIVFGPGPPDAVRTTVEGLGTTVATAGVRATFRILAKDRLGNNAGYNPVAGLPPFRVRLVWPDRQVRFNSGRSWCGATYKCVDFFFPFPDTVVAA